MNRVRVLILIAASQLGACATIGGTGWQEVPAMPVAHRFAPCTITLPVGWIYIQTQREDSGDVLVATRRGVSLQAIRVTRRENSKAFPAIEKSASPDTPTEELARRYIEDTASRFELDVVDVLENRPVRLGGLEGFRVHVRYRVGELRYQAIAHGISTSRGFYLVTYNAPTLHYFEADLPSFEAAVASFTFMPVE